MKEECWLLKLSGQIVGSILFQGLRYECAISGVFSMS